jgi:hypothetical protein
LFRRGIPLAISIATVFSAVLFSILAAFLWFLGGRSGSHGVARGKP